MTTLVMIVCLLTPSGAGCVQITEPSPSEAACQARAGVIRGGVVMRTILGFNGFGSDDTVQRQPSDGILHSVIPINAKIKSIRVQVALKDLHLLHQEVRSVVAMP